MNKSILLILTILFIILMVIPGHAQNLGVGIILGEPTGFSIKQWMTQNTALSGAIAWSFGEEGALHLHGDYLLHKDDVFKVTKGQLPIYYGIGCRFKLEEESRIGVRFPVGINYLFADAPLDFFCEIVPIMDFAPETAFNMNGALGVRIYFDSSKSGSRSYAGF